MWEKWKKRVLFYKYRQSEKKFKVVFKKKQEINSFYLPFYHQLKTPRQALVQRDCFSHLFLHSFVVNKKWGTKCSPKRECKEIDPKIGIPNAIQQMDI